MIPMPSVHSSKTIRARQSFPAKQAAENRIRHDKEAYKGRNVVERCFCRLKDFRCIETRYDKLARNFFLDLLRCYADLLAII
jgi:transposase